jgi:hypothetical protein
MGNCEEDDDFPKDYTYNTFRMRRKIPYAAAALLAIFAASLAARLWAADQNQPDPILEFYVKKAAATFTSRDPMAAGVNFSLRATTYYKDLSRGGKVTLSDSSIIDYFYSFGEVDSTVVIAAPKHNHPSFDITVPNVFTGDYVYNFFPNDTGGSDLSIGFDTRDTTSPDPTGIAVIDRDRYFLKRLYLFYPNDVAYKRYSRSLRFTDFEGYIFPDSVSESRAEAGIFSSKHYRVETEIGQLQIYR